MVTVTDVNGCSDSATVAITEPPVLASTITSTDVTCFGFGDGTIDLTVTGGVTSYSYSWNDGATTEDRSGLGPGTYTVTVTDANGCALTDGATINEPAALGITLTMSDYNGVNISCFARQDGSIDLGVTGGITPYTYAWSNGETTEDLINLFAGTYDVTVTDANGCTIAGSTTLIEPTILATNLEGTNVTCNGACDGIADLTVVVGGTPPYSFLWSTGETTQDVSGLCAGLYFVTVSDINGCQTNSFVNISEPAALSPTFSVDDVDCFGGSDGSIDLLVTGGITPYGYVWSNGATTEDISGLTIGTYVVTVTDSNGCTVVDSAIVNEPPLLTASISGTDVSCNAGSDGAADLTPAGGTPPYTYAWSGGETTQDISGLVAGTYVVTVTDDHACTATASVTINEPPVLTASIAGTNVSCNGGSDGMADLTVGGGTSPYSYIWNTTETTEDISGLTAGTYTVTVTDANGCTETASIPKMEAVNTSGSVIVTLNMAVHPFASVTVTVYVLATRLLISSLLLPVDHTYE